MAGQQRKKKDAEVEVVEEQALPDTVDVRPEVQREEEDREATEAQALEEFNSHIQSLVRNFVQQEIAGLDERIRDLETLIGQKANDPVMLIAGSEPEEVDSIPSYRPQSVEDYSPAHQGGDGTPWYTG